MGKSVFGHDTTVGIELKHLLDQINGLFIHQLHIPFRHEFLESSFLEVVDLFTVR